ncbi:EscC/YscC/HrcC family type III secretion system outer membrane ring protein [Citrobacter braakii]|uniref:EscC/YscC/HrcC family type III secretion system outer membrane ring protein n=1 Tax=Citrobacter braakii TaxID=57706 RepID=UPI0019071788|nr:EscC/YscC/HrcC family type III secretion system outer membrane ring protein [Citrobacter braakii]MBJ9048896.1 EscC/YscC/HrcC family type III secretion system outer membrane ring protein [Citrobacter braakii]
MKIKKMVIFSALFLCLCAHAQTLAWKGANFSLRARKISLSAVLQNLAENYDTPVIIDPAIMETFSGAIPPASPVAILNRLTTQYNLVTWLDGNTLFVYPSSRVAHRVITLNTLPVSTFIRYLRKRDVPEKISCEARTIPGVNAIDVSGVPACIARITQLASMLDGEMTRRRDDAVSLVVYPLKYATAVDDHYQYRDQNVVVPGIVSVLRDMSRGSTPTTSGSSAATQGLPMFSADPRQNAVIVRDRSVNMAGYRKLISELDRRPQMIEISVTIIDVDAGDVSQLGIDWSAALSLGGGSISFNGPDSNSGGGFSTVISNTPSFMARLVALEKNSHAYILSQPSVVTLNNIQAVLDKNITFYTKLQGDKVAKLESITTGSLLRVTPRLLEEKGKQNIMLSLNIQDGQQNPPLSQDEPLPEVQNSEIASQATLYPGQSLLLGGFKQDKQMQAQNKIPLLGDIPIIGHLFRNDLNQTHSVIRLFLIKATVVNNNSSHG